MDNLLEHLTLCAKCLPDPVNASVVENIFLCGSPSMGISACKAVSPMPSCLTSKATSHLFHLVSFYLALSRASLWFNDLWLWSFYVSICIFLFGALTNSRASLWFNVSASVALEFLRFHFAFEASGIVVNGNGSLEFSPWKHLWKPRCRLFFANALNISRSYIFRSVLEICFIFVSSIRVLI